MGYDDDIPGFDHISENDFLNIMGYYDDEDIMGNDGEDRVPCAYYSKDKKVNFRDLYGRNIWKIGNFFFYNNQYLEEVCFPEKFYKIGRGAFCSCPNLKKVKNIRKLTIYGDECFCNCPNLEELEFFDVTIEGSREMFAGCTRLKRVDLDTAYITSFGEYCFKNCYSLERIKIPSSVKDLGKGCFLNCTKLRSIDISPNVKRIGSNCFNGCRNLRVVNYYSEAVFLDNIFIGCNNLEKINFYFSTPEKMRDFLRKSELILKEIMKSCPKVVFNFKLCALDIYEQYDVWNMVDSMGLGERSHLSIQRETIHYEPHMEDDHITNSNMFFIDMVKSISDRDVKDRIVSLYNSCKTLPEKMRRNVLDRLANIFNTYLNKIRGYSPKFKQNDKFYSYSLTSVKSDCIKELNELEMAINLSSSSIDYVIRCTRYKEILNDKKTVSGDKSIEGKLGLIASSSKYLNSELNEKYLLPIYNHLNDVIERNQKLLDNFDIDFGKTLNFSESPDDTLFILVDSAYDTIQNYMKFFKPLEDIRNAMSPQLPQNENLILDDLALFILEIRHQINNFSSKEYKEMLEKSLYQALLPYIQEIDILLTNKTNIISDLYLKFLNRRIRIVLRVFLYKMYFFAQRDEYMKKYKNADILIGYLKRTVSFLKSTDDTIDDDEYDSNIIYSFLIDSLSNNVMVPISRLKEDYLVRLSLINVLEYYINKLDDSTVSTVEKYNEYLYEIMKVLAKVISDIVIYYDKKKAFQSLNPVYRF